MPTARDWRWWRSALLRRPWLVVTATGGLLATATLKQAFQTASTPLAGSMAVAIGSGLVAAALRTVHVRERSRTEKDDVRREQMPRRPPRDGSADEPLRPHWSWHGPRARHAMRWSATLAGFGCSLGASLLSDPWGWRQGGGDRVAFVVIVAGMVVAPVITAIALPGIVAWRSRRLLARTLRPLPLRLLGVGGMTQNWYAVREDAPDGERLVMPRFPGRSLLVAGDVVQVWMADEPPDHPRERLGDTVPVALTAQGQTLWPTLGRESVLRAGGHLEHQRRREESC